MTFHGTREPRKGRVKEGISEVEKNCLLEAIRGKVAIVAGVDSNKDLVVERRRSERRARGAPEANNDMMK